VHKCEFLKEQSAASTSHIFCLPAALQTNGSKNLYYDFMDLTHERCYAKCFGLRVSWTSDQATAGDEKMRNAVGLKGHDSRATATPSSRNAFVIRRKGNVMLTHAIKTYMGSRGIALLILNLPTRGQLYATAAFPTG
jgi:hypothetical protein